MYIKSVEFKNFNSYGNVVQRIDFENNKSDLYLLTGAVGAGKTTIAEVITYCIYGRIEGKNKGDLVNRINKNMWCRIVLISKNKTVEIIRGIKPNIFDVFIEGEKNDTSGNLNVQEYLETEIFTIPYQVFKNIIVLSLNDFKSFLTMSPTDKRNIIDRVFGFYIINEMRDKIKNERRVIKDKIKTLTDELNIIEESIFSINTKIENLEKIQKTNQQKLTNELKEKLNKLNSNKEKIEDSINKINTKKEQLDTVLNNKVKEKNNINFNIKTIDNKLKLYNNSTCPTCGSKLDTKEHISIKLQIEKEKLTYNESFNIIKKDIDELTDKIRQLNIKINEVNEINIKNNLSLNQIKKQLLNINSNIINDNSTQLFDLLTENNNKKSDKIQNQKLNNNEDSFLELLENILGDDGVKNMAMKTIIPSINQSILNMSKRIHLPYLIKFNEKFDCEIISYGEDVNPRTLSSGQRKKVNIIIIITLMSMLKMRYPTINLLFLDEIFSSIDPPGIYEILKLVSEISKESKINTWVVNHSELPTELFDKKVEVIQDGGFSKLKIETIL